MLFCLCFLSHPTPMCLDLYWVVSKITTAAIFYDPSPMLLRVKINDRVSESELYGTVSVIQGWPRQVVSLPRRGNHVSPPHPAFPARHCVQLLFIGSQLRATLSSPHSSARSCSCASLAAINERQDVCSKKFRPCWAHQKKPGQTSRAYAHHEK